MSLESITTHTHTRKQEVVQSKLSCRKCVHVLCLCVWIRVRTCLLTAMKIETCREKVAPVCRFQKPGSCLQARMLCGVARSKHEQSLLGSETKLTTHCPGPAVLVCNHPLALRTGQGWGCPWGV